MTIAYARTRSPLDSASLRLIIVGTLLGTVRNASGQCSTDWQPGEGIPGVDRTVYASTVWDPDASGPQPPLLVVAGQFRVAGDSVAYSISTWNGTQWSPLGSGLRGASNSRVSALAVYNNELIAAGFFEFSGLNPVRSIARWDGSAWQPLTPPSGGINGIGIYALTVFENELIAAGNFVSIDGVTLNGIGRWNGSTWQPIGTGIVGLPGGTIYSLAVYNNDLIAGGQFFSIGGVSTGSIAKWNGSSWSGLGTGIAGSSNVFALFVSSSELVVGGDFFSAGGVSSRCIARWNGTGWQSYGAGVTTGYVKSLGSYAGSLFVGGSFASISGTPANNIAKWTGSAWQALGNGTGGEVDSITEYDGRLVAGGSWPFYFAGGVTVGSISAWDGSQWSKMGSGVGVEYSDPAINCATSFLGDLVVGGQFSSIGDIQTSGIARRTGLGWQPLGSGISIGTWGQRTAVYAMTTFGNELIAAGDFSEAGGQPANQIARWNGMIWQSLGTGIGGPGIGDSVLALATFGNDLIAGGDFTNAGGTPANRIARWDGSAWHSLGTGLTGGVRAFTVYGNELIVGGNFTMAGGGSASRIARWNGTTWGSLGSGMNGTVLSLAVYDGYLIAGGEFTTPAGRIARWNGTTWQSLGTGAGGSASVLGVSALAHFQDKLVAGGNFTSIGGVNASLIAQWDGAIWQPYGLGLDRPVVPGTFGNSAGSVKGLAGMDEGLYAVGTFTVAGDRVSAYWARWGTSTGTGTGDGNGDGFTDGNDVQSFVDYLIQGEQPMGGECVFDITGDGIVNSSDVGAFVDRLLGVG